MGAELFARIRSACARVAARARHVAIDAARVGALADDLLRAPPPAASPDPARHQRGDAASTLAYVITLDSVNFGSGWFPFLRKRPGLSGYFTVARALAERFDREGAWSAGQLRELTAGAVAEVLGQDLEAPERAELMELYARALRDLGSFLSEDYGGAFEGPVREAGGSAAALVESLARMPLYRDVSRYEDFEVPFYKRAQITAWDLSAAFGGQGPGGFRDLDRLTIFADNLVPHVLRLEGVLRYAPALAARVDAGELVAAGTPEEVELRAAAVEAVERGLAALSRRGARWTAAQVDQVLWSRGQAPAFKARPRHRTRTPYY